jgi:hypothetical protein
MKYERISKEETSWAKMEGKSGRLLEKRKNSGQHQIGSYGGRFVDLLISHRLHLLRNGLGACFRFL